MLFQGLVVNIISVLCITHILHFSNNTLNQYMSFVLLSLETVRSGDRKHVYLYTDIEILAHITSGVRKYKHIDV